MLHNALAFGWSPPFPASYAIEFLCMFAAKLMVLDCMNVFAASQGGALPKRWAAMGRIVMAVVFLHF
jgi:hypothetical protein